jgi:short-subunit dehydrogenase
MKHLHGKKALVTGAASGIGRAIAVELARHGTHVYLLDINEPELAQTARQCRALGVQAVARRCDLSQPHDISAAVQALLGDWGTLDVLVNNAGIAYYGPVTRVSWELWQRMLAVNLHAPIQLTHELLPLLLQRPEAHIVNMASICGLVAGARQTPYHVTKFGLVGFSESLRADLAGHRIGITCVCPGLVKTNLWHAAVQGRNDPQRRRTAPAWIATSAQRVARRTVRAIRRNHGLVVMTPVARLLYWFKRLSPRLLDALQRIRRKKKKPPAPPDAAAGPSRESAERRAA